MNGMRMETITGFVTQWQHTQTNRANIMSSSEHDTSDELREAHDIDRAIADPAHPITLFSLTWCSYCRATKQLLQHLGLSYRVIELDHGQFLEPRLQQQARTRLQQLTRSGTLPQLFIGRDLVGGYTDTYAAWKSGRLTSLLKSHGIVIDTTESAR